ncbi:FMN-dependent NADH-azoreductase [Bacillus massiliigorillae]|uniref:FMN-dependent NADH-azoreductase n=1 Tax=Bacillus massiliigorillae TaxID=1243664 RepID=UPI0003A56381|nr:FMN-dependent NADH-azoreductase [Bacillus massiliigorillae]
MTNILFIKANDRPTEQSISMRMYETFLQQYKQLHPSDSITQLDLFKENPPYYGNAAILGVAKQKNGLELTEEEIEAVSYVERFIEQYLSADKIVIAFPLWNGTAPTPLISYLSYITQAGKTFTYSQQGPVGLGGQKKVIILHARGGDYTNSTAVVQEMAISYVETILNMIGVDHIETMIIEGHNQYKDRAEEIITAGLEQVASIAKYF